jgi:membrane protein insertase Oxa1/YidC/SpoIIIJ
MFNLVIAIFYQPFLNALVFIYWVLDNYFHTADMGIAVIIFTVLIRIALLPLTIASTETEEEARKIGIKYDELLKIYRDEPLNLEKEKKRLINDHKSTVQFEAINIAIQLIIAVILWRVFGQGLMGEDLHLIYSWMPSVETPFNLTFLGIIELTQPSFIMNIMSSGLLFIVESLSLAFSPLPPNRQERAMQFLLPIVAFIYLYTMPAGKKFFVVTTLIFSIVFIFIREIGHTLHLVFNKNKK